MPLLDILILALIQGITEFLPISSSGHLVIAHKLMEHAPTAQSHAKNLALDIAVHVGTLLSVIVYFRQDVKNMLYDLKSLATKNHANDNTRLHIYILISSLPVIIAGLLLYLWQPNWLRSTEIVAWTTLIFGIILWVVDAAKPTTQTLKEINWRDALIIGLAQMLALIPGTSRSGITITAGRYLGYSRTESARYALLLSIIAISGAGVLSTISLIKTGNTALTMEALIAAGLAFLSGWGAIALMMKFLEKATFKLFALYRIVLGLGLLAMIYNGIL